MTGKNLQDRHNPQALIAKAEVLFSTEHFEVDSTASAALPARLDAAGRPEGAARQLTAPHAERRTGEDFSPFAGLIGVILSDAYNHVPYAVLASSRAR